MTQFSDHIESIRANVAKCEGKSPNEEATKNWFVLPMLSALGYEIFNPDEVLPEFTADVGTKKGEKVDYAIVLNGEILALIEVKAFDTDLSSQHYSQLYRYFAATPAPLAILTNGVEYNFFSDSMTENKMDDEPFFVFNLLQHNRHSLEKFHNFSRNLVNKDQIVKEAYHNLCVSKIQQFLKDQAQQPSREFVKTVTSQFFSKRYTDAAIEELATMVQEAITSFNPTK